MRAVAERCRAARGVGGTGGGGRAGRGQRPRGLAVLPFLGMAPAGPASARPGGAARRPYGARPLAGPRSSPSDFVGWCVDRVSRAASLKVAPPAAVRQLEGGASLRQSHAWQLGTGHFHAPHHARALPSKSGRDARRAHAHFVSTPRRAWVDTGEEHVSSPMADVDRARAHAPDRVFAWPASKQRVFAAVAPAQASMQCAPLHTVTVGVAG